MPQGQLWPVMRIRNSKLAKKIAEGNLAKPITVLINFDIYVTQTIVA